MSSDRFCLWLLTTPVSCHVPRIDERKRKDPDEERLFSSYRVYDGAQSRKGSRLLGGMIDSKLEVAHVFKKVAVEKKGSGFS